MIDVKIINTMEVEKASDSDPESLVPTTETIKLNSGILIKAQHILNGPEGLNIMLADGDVLLNVSEDNVQYQIKNERRPQGGQTPQRSPKPKEKARWLRLR